MTIALAEFLFTPTWPVTPKLVLPGVTLNYASTPDSAANSISGDIDIRVRVAFDDWTPAVEAVLLAKWHTTGNQRSYRLYLQTGGTIVFSWSPDGTTVLTASGWTNTYADGSVHWIGVTFDVDNGAAGRTAVFYDSADDTYNPAAVTWTLQNTVTTGGVTNLFGACTQEVEVGSSNSGFTTMFGKVYYADIRSGIGGAPVNVFDVSTVTKLGTRNPSTVLASTGETWTVNGSAWDWEAPTSRPVSVGGNVGANLATTGAVSFGTGDL